MKTVLLLLLLCGGVDEAASDVAQQSPGLLICLPSLLPIKLCVLSNVCSFLLLQAALAPPSWTTLLARAFCSVWRLVCIRRLSFPKLGCTRSLSNSTPQPTSERLMLPCYLLQALRHLQARTCQEVYWSDPDTT